MSSHQLNRQTFTISRMMEFFTAKELQMQIGHWPGLWPAALLKELVDNALDACEGTGVQPNIRVVVENDFLTVEDNGPGMPRETLERSLDYAIRVSDKSHYVSPSRGQLGNALKCVWAAPFVASKSDFGCVEIVTDGHVHRIEVSLDRIAQKPVLEHTIRDAVVKNGTSITMHWPNVASSLLPSGGDFFYNAFWLVRQYAAFNPHARFSIQAMGETEEISADSEAWVKWSPADPTSPHWYSNVSDGVEWVPIHTDVNTHGPANRYRFVLFVEKEGFNELLDAARFAERYDLAIMSTKGMSVTASRQLVDRLSEQSVTVLVLHDFDKSGFSIVQTLRTDTRRYHYSVAPRVIDLGLRLADVHVMNLEKEEVTYDSGVDPRENLRDGGASEEECAFLVEGGKSKNWYGHRVELNAMSSDQFVAWLDKKLEMAGVRKVIPDEIVLGRAYRRAVCAARIQKEIDRVVAEYDGTGVEVPDGLSQQIEQMIQGTTLSWDLAVAEMARVGRTKSDSSMNF